MEALRNVQIFGICINPMVVITVDAEFGAVKYICMHISGRFGLLQMSSAQLDLPFCVGVYLALYVRWHYSKVISTVVRRVNASCEESCTDSPVSPQTRGCAEDLEPFIKFRGGP